MSRIPPLVVVALVLSSLPAAARGSLSIGDPVPASVRLPDNIHVSRDLAPVVEQLLRRSDTFRRQCAVVAAAQVRITITVTTALLEGPVRARATIAELPEGLWAIIELRPVADYAELLPHEMEHVIEQIEGVDLEERVRAGDPGVSMDDDGTYETARARAAGRTAAGEYYAEPDPALTAAGRAATRVWRTLSSRPRGGAWTRKLRAGCHKEF
jgi:hypothetical protein